MRVCVVGSGGREHALAHVLARTADVVVTPGNPGMAPPITVTDVPVEEIEADLYVVGPEAPLVDGLADSLRRAGKAVMGPGADGALLEGSKAFMKEVLNAAGVPTARFSTFDAMEARAAEAYLETLPGPWVIKTDGLAAGKGVLVAHTLDEARDDVAAKLSGTSFGDAGRHIVIEEGLAGEECSLLVLCDGTRAVPLVPAQDFKRIGDGDVGPNTGGMGAYAPMPHVGPDATAALMDAAVLPLVEELRRRGIDYRGVLYAGLMLTAEGPKVIEYNVRFGDPEAQVVLPLLSCDAAELFLAVANGDLDGAAPAGLLGRRRRVRRHGLAGLPRAPPHGRHHRGVDTGGPVGRRRRGGHRLPRRHPRGTTPTGRSTPPAGACSASPRWRRRWPRRATAPTRRPHRSNGRACRCATTSRPRRPARRGGAMIPRYAPPDMAALFSDTARFALWLEVELLATEAQAAVGVVPAEDAATCRAKAPTVDDAFVADVLEREKVTDHDVAAFVDVVQERIGAPAGSHIHYGLTSSDVVDTALCATLTRAADLLLADLDAFVAALKARALELLHVPVTGRTHGMHAEPTTFGAKFALWALQADRDRRRMRAARDARRRGQAVRRGRHLLQHRPRGRGPGLRRARPDAGAGHPGDRPGPPRRVLLRLRVHRRHHRAHVHRDPPPGPQRARRGRGALRRRPEGQLGHAAQAQPDPLGAALRPGPPAARLPRRRAGGRGAVARARHLAQLGGAGGAAGRVHAGLLHAAQGHGAGRGAGGPPRAGAART